MGSTRFTRRLFDHLSLMIVGVGVAGAVYYLAPSSDARMRLSLGSAYVAIAFLTTTLTIGPLNAVRGARRPVSIDSRRDVGIWAAIWALIHTVVGLQVHMRGRMSEYFLQPGDKPLLSRVRHDMFGLANYSGLLAAIIVVVLAAISNDWSLRRLGAGRWKRIQQLNYVLFAITIAHAVLYQIIEKRSLPFVFTIGVFAATAVVLQIARAVCQVKQSST
jgi:sulfoxide reductase heme-binding subunit YedZ